MAVLTIARELGAIVAGEELTLCSTLGMHCISKSTLENRFAQLGISREFLSRFDECKPGLLGAITNSAEYYWETLRTVILQELLQDNIAVFGRGGNFLLHGLVECLRIKFTAPEDFRIRQIAMQLSIPESEAGKMIRQSDNAKEKFCNFYYGQSWKAPENYDLVINTETISMESVAELLPPLLPAPVTDLRKQQLRLIVESQIIKHALAAIPELQLVYPEVIFDESGTVTLRGNVPSQAASRRAEEIVRGMPQVDAVNNELKVILKDIPNRLPPMMH